MRDVSTWNIFRWVRQHADCSTWNNDPGASGHSPRNCSTWNNGPANPSSRQMFHVEQWAFVLLQLDRTLNCSTWNNGGPDGWALQRSFRHKQCRGKSL